MIFLLRNKNVYRKFMRKITFDFRSQAFIISVKLYNFFKLSKKKFELVKIDFDSDK